MRKRITRTIIVLTLLSAVSQQDFKPLVDLIAFPLGISLFFIAPLTVLAVLLSPFALGIGLWLLWQRLRHGRIPGWVHELIPARVKRRRAPAGSRPRRPYRRDPDEAPTLEQPALATGSAAPLEHDGSPAARAAGEMAGVHHG
ncbi:MAG: hypothetical protein ACLP1Q_13010 [Solirubrobacteraceae bacterium]